MTNTNRLSNPATRSMALTATNSRIVVTFDPTILSDSEVLHTLLCDVTPYGNTYSVKFGKATIKANKASQGLASFTDWDRA
jgi:hypothetical protein